MLSVNKILLHQQNIRFSLLSYKCFVYGVGEILTMRARREECITAFAQQLEGNNRPPDLCKHEYNLLLFVFLALQPILVVFSQPGRGL
jgi:hypothetical protein